MAEPWVRHRFQADPDEFEAAEDLFVGAEERPCREGNCTEWADPQTGKAFAGFGPVGCPCGSPWWRRWLDRRRFYGGAPDAR